MTTQGRNVLQQISQAVDRRKHATVRAFLQIAIQALADTQTRSPVDLGVYRASHALTVGKPTTEAPDPSAFPKADRRGGKGAASTPPPPGGGPGAQAVTRQMAQAVSDLSKAELPVVGTLMLYLATNVKYASVLEDGSSKQAPKGIYKITRAVTKRRLEELAKRGPRT